MHHSLKQLDRTAVKAHYSQVNRSDKKHKTASLYRCVYGALFTGFGLYQFILIHNSGRPLLLILAGYITTTGLLLLLPAAIRLRLTPSFAQQSQFATLLLWLALPFITLGSLLLLQGRDRALALTGISAAILFTLVAVYIIKKKKRQ